MFFLVMHEKHSGKLKGKLHFHRFSERDNVLNENYSFSYKAVMYIQHIAHTSCTVASVVLCPYLSNIITSFYVCWGGKIVTKSSYRPLKYFNFLFTLIL